MAEPKRKTKTAPGRARNARVKLRRRRSRQSSGKGDQPVFKVKDLARLAGCEYEGDGEVEIRGAASLENASPGDIVFVAQAKFRHLLETTKASAAVVSPEEKSERIPILKAANPHLTFVRIVEVFFKPYRPAPGIHKTAAVAKTALIAKTASVGAKSVIGDGVEVEEGSVIFPLVTLYPGVKIGKECLIHSGVSVREGVRIGDRVIIHNGAVIGADGFGYIKLEDGTHLKIPQKGTVVIEDDVEVGANSCIDRAALGETVIRRGVKIDDLVMVAHNVEVGEHTILTAQVGIAGSSKVGKSVVMGGQAGVADHVEVGDNVIVSAKSGVAKSVPAGLHVAGYPHIDVRDWRKISVLLPRLYDLFKDVKMLREKVEALEKK
jgi:UDP-3-O-[3-hydroxymyristoyl] glucosamine N-acyltransferase